MIHTKLSSHRQPQWFSLAGIHTRGYAFDAQGKLWQGAALCDLLQGVQDAVSLEAIVSRLNGCFAIIIQTESSTLAAVDRMASMPLYWVQEQGIQLISDVPQHAASQFPNKDTDARRISEYLLSGFCSGNDTLQKGLNVLQAGQILEIRDSQSRIIQYYRYKHLKSTPTDLATLYERLDTAHLNSIRRLIQSLDGRPVAIPLSGGYDSRLIAILLKRLGYKHISAFSYGQRHSREVRISHQVARLLEIPWTFVEHRPQDWYQAYQSPARKEFYAYAGNVSSRPHIQDWLAVKELSQCGHWHRDTVFLPGHSGDFVQGSNIPPAFSEMPIITREILLQNIWKSVYRLWHAVDDDVYQRLSQLVPSEEEMDQETAASLLEGYLWQQLQPRYILNSLRVYEYFGYEWRIPWWDAEILDFWQKVPISLRSGRQLYKAYIDTKRNTGIGVYHKENMPRRIRERLIRQKWGYIYDPRFSRFAPLYLGKAHRHSQLGALLPQNLELPEYIKANQAIAKCNINAVSSLVALKEWWEG